MDRKTSRDIDRNTARSMDIKRDIDRNLNIQNRMKSWINIYMYVKELI